MLSCASKGLSNYEEGQLLLCPVTIAKAIAELSSEPQVSRYPVKHLEPLKISSQG